MRFLLSRRWLLFLGAVLVLAFVAFRLGEWQFDRLAQREQRNAITERNLETAPVPVATVLSVDVEVDAEDEWRHVTARGTYAEEHTVVVRYQTRDGKSGVDVVTPLVTDEGPALLVNRGWLATGNTGTTPDLPAPPAGEVEVTGWVRADGSGSATTVEDGSTRAVSSTAIGETLPFPVYGGFVELDAETPPPDQPLGPVEEPDLGEGPHFFYGLQWWFFAALAVFGFGYLVRDERRRQRTRPTSPEEEVSAGPEPPTPAGTSRSARPSEGAPPRP